LANIIINTLLLAAVLDYTLTPFFDAAHDVAYTRIGAVYPDSVKIQVRHPVNDTLLILYRDAASNLQWKRGPTVQPQEQFDWVETVRLTNLWPDTKYECQYNVPFISNQLPILSWIDTIASLNNSTLPYPRAPVPFRTFPDPRLHSGRRFRFVASSCLSPNFPYGGHSNKNTIRGFDLLADYLEGLDMESDSTTGIETNASVVSERPSTDFLLLLGDFIYADVPVFIGDDKASYRRLYRRNYQSPSFRRIYEKFRKLHFVGQSSILTRNTAIIHIYDDHEVMICLASLTFDLIPEHFSSSTTMQGTPLMVVHM
jgi:alkaline phosphatase D